MIPACGDGFAATGPVRRARKSELQPGTFRGVPALAKRLRSTSPVWRWYFAHELAVYRAFAEVPPPVRAPRLLAADADTLVIELIPGTPLATRRTPHAELAPATIDELVAIHARLASWRGSIAAETLPAAVRSALRTRLLEDPTAPAWIADGIRRAATAYHLFAPDVAARLVEVLDGAPTAFAHGDLLLRNVVGGALVDWECAGMHLRDWDLALLWSQLAPDGRAYLERGRGAAFTALCAFAVAREIRFLHAYRVRDRHPDLVRQRTDLAALVARL
jgi:hypothetical protein